MSQNLIQNPEFSSGSMYWSPSKWYPENQVEFATTGGVDGCCVKLKVRSAGDPGQSSIAQSVMLKVGQQYILTFYAKRNGNVDIWAEASSNSSTQFSSSFKSAVVNGGGYTKVSFPFTARGNGSTVETSIRLIAGSAGGTVWIDRVEMLGDPVDVPGTGGFDANRYVETTEKTVLFKRPDPTDNDNYLVFPVGAKFVLQGIVDNMVAVAFGTKTGGTITAYIRKSKCKSSDTYLEEYPEMRMATIARSLVGVYGSQLGLGGNYCENFIHWLAGACCLSNDVYCGSELCGPAVKHYVDEGLYDVRNSSSGLSMQQGDIVYYDVAGYGTNTITAAHTGYVVATSGNTYTAIEGNAGEATANGQQRVALVTGNRFTGTNDTHGRILHGVAHPFGRG